MSGRTVVLVPRRRGFADRERLWAWLQPWWRENVGLPIVEGWHEHGPFNRSAAINSAAAEAGGWDVAVIIDADVMLDPGQVHAAAAAARDGQLAVGFTERLHLHASGTERVLAGYRGNWRPLARTIIIESVSSCVVVGRQLWEQAGGFDEEFVGWGWEDVAFRIACEAHSARPLVRIGGPLWHLHHRVSAGNNPQEPTFVANRERGELYRARQWQPEAIDRLRRTRLSVPA